MPMCLMTLLHLQRLFGFKLLHKVQEHYFVSLILFSCLVLVPFLVLILVFYLIFMMLQTLCC